jgi:MFS superfamily sulfate permease-like transporter
MPGLGALFVRPREWLRGDLIAGVTVAAYLVPQVMAYTVWPVCRRSPAHPPTVILAAAALVFLFAVARFLPVLSGPLLAVVIATAAVVTFDLDGRYGIAVIGPVPSGLPDLALPDLAELPRLVLPALGVLLVAYTDFILTARAFADRADRTAALDPDRKFLALGPPTWAPAYCTASPSAAAPAVRRWRPRRARAVRRTRWSRGRWCWPSCSSSARCWPARPPSCSARSSSTPRSA